MLIAVLVVAVCWPELSASAHSSHGAPATFAQARKWARDYYAAHSGKDRDINAKSSSELARDPAARRLLSICGRHQRPVIPMLAWEYGGSDHPWIHPGASALAYCVYIPSKRNTAHWRYDANNDHVTADIYVRFPRQNPCRHKRGKRQVTACLGDPTNMEILVDTASLHDGAGAGMDLSEASTTLRLIEPGGGTVTLASEQ
jgi:hypothetical protein